LLVVCYLRAPLSRPFPYRTLFRSERAGMCRAPVRLHDETLGRPVEVGLVPRHETVDDRRWQSGRCDEFEEATLELAAHERGLVRSEEHTSELQSRVDLVCRLLLAE